MPNNTNLAPQEMIELHELINSEIINIKRTQESISNVSDTELMNYMQQYLNSKTSALQQMENFINNQGNSGNQQNNQSQQYQQNNQNQQNSQNNSNNNQNQSE